jgi:uncharacterized protein
MNPNEIFYNERGRLRSGLRFVIFWFSFYLLAVVFVVGAIGILANLPIGFSQGSLLAFAVPIAISAAIAIFLGWFYGKIFEDLPFRALGLGLTKNWWKDLFFGVLIGAFSFIIAALIAYLFGGMRFEINQSAGAAAIALTLVVTLALFTIGSISEEALFRGYPLQTLGRAKHFPVGILLTSVLFAAAHNTNPGATAFSWFNTFLAGIWFCVAYLKTRNLWLAIGIHLAWNWTQGAFFGVNVSGLSEIASAPILRVAEKGNAFVGGGDYGIEGGVACTIALVISTVLIYFLPILKPTEELLALSSEEKPAREP